MLKRKFKTDGLKNEGSTLDLSAADERAEKLNNIKPKSKNPNASMMNDQ
jgi:hypothetical protein